MKENQELVLQREREREKEALFVVTASFGVSKGFYKCLKMNNK